MAAPGMAHRLTSHFAFARLAHLGRLRCSDGARRARAPPPRRGGEPARVSTGRSHPRHPPRHRAARSAAPRGARTARAVAPRAVLSGTSRPTGAQRQKGRGGAKGSASGTRCAELRIAARTATSGRAASRRHGSAWELLSSRRVKARGAASAVGEAPFRGNRVNACKSCVARPRPACRGRSRLICRAARLTLRLGARRPG